MHIISRQPQEIDLGVDIYHAGNNAYELRDDRSKTRSFYSHMKDPYKEQVHKDIKAAGDTQEHNGHSRVADASKGVGHYVVLKGKEEAYEHYAQIYCRFLCDFGRSIHPQEDVVCQDKACKKDCQ